MWGVNEKRFAFQHASDLFEASLVSITELALPLCSCPAAFDAREQQTAPSPD
jgi:hypothetical protein